MKQYPLRQYTDLLRQESLLLGDIPQELDLETPVTLVSCDSGQVTAGTLFICKGANFREEYLLEAADRGAFCYVSEQVYPKAPIPCILVREIRIAMEKLAALFYNNPWDALNLVGITGTKGKSTTAYYIKSILDRYMEETGGKESGILSSIDNYDGEERAESHLTTPEPLDLFRHLECAVEHGITYFTMEVSSQALKYDRVRDVRFSAGCFLNIGTDHISPIEHENWEDYFSSKLKLMGQCRTAVVNLDMDHVDRVLDAASPAERIITFSEKDSAADVFGYEIQKEENDDVSFRVRTDGFDDLFRLGMPGLFNVENALAAIAVCSSLGVPQSVMYEGLLSARAPGRMEIYTSKDRRIIAIVDYAHNVLSFENLFESVRKEYPGFPIRIVFGAPGGKAFNRRKDLGLIAGKYACHAYLTEEDPGEEDPASIARDIAEYVSAQNCPYSIIVDRGEAIRAAVQESEPNTVILITGKGAETREKRNREYVPVTSDVEYTKRALAEYDSGH